MCAVCGWCGAGKARVKTRLVAQVVTRVLRLTAAYDGTAYSGWQRQENAVSVQAAIEAGLADIEGHRVVVHGAGRTDAGVHAVGQVASFELTHNISARSLQRALNAKLPHDIRVTDLSEAPPGFHARFWAVRKHYRYRIDRGVVANPLEHRYAWHVPGPLDLEAVSVASKAFVGRHDFATFQTAAAQSAVTSTVRTMYAVEVKPVGQMLLIDVEGDGFLRHMVRAMVGTLVDVGFGRRQVTDMAHVLASGRRDKAGPTAPARGLYLLRVDFREP